MKAKSALIVIVFLLALTKVRANDFHPILNTSMGMVNISLTENTSTLTATDESVTVEEDAAAATAASVISFEVNYEFKNYADKSYFAKAVVPLMTADGSGVFMGSIGANFYIGSLSSIFSFKDKGTQIYMIPKTRYYWGASTGVGYVVYNTISAKKSDIFFDLGIHGGMVYNFSRKWGMRGELGAGRGTGIATSSFGIKIFLGTSYYIGL
ncbi:MAG: hypothetical protein KC493_05330 [Bacteriovoracaceae bacterium]|nr:hypothetical protein [Bacteriovoracaceae bacterium]